MGVSTITPMATAAPPITAKQLEHIKSDRYRFELVRGRLVVIDLPGFPHNVVATEVARLLGNWVAERGLGFSVAADTGFALERDPDTVLAPDFAFVRAGRPVWDTAFPEIAPDFVVEVRAPSDTLRAVNRKAEAWLAAGAGEAWVLDIVTRTLILHLPGLAPRELRGDDQVRPVGTLAGFACRVRDFFAPLDLP